MYGDPDVHQLLALGARHHALHICTPREINVSRLIAWLLDPNEGHGLGDKALRSLLAQAGRSENAANLDLKTYRFLEPAKVHNLALSSLIVKTELNVLAKLPAKGKASAVKATERKRDLLDIVAIDPGLQLCVAIENKFGAAEGPTQLTRYMDGLANLFPKYTRIHIFLDKRDEVPGHEKWLGVGYGWLSEFLRSHEQSPSVAREGEGRQRPKKGAEWFDLYQRDLAPEAAVKEVLLRMTELQSSLKPLL
ncbi:PD-(D/E)XK nuclease family protein [Paucibacter sp. DJ1R-11]|uniref:PD-(D/E)XK nuclease family protein n=1 Tax=Paucibacter sp. DJ1R-11 TaxID=2893556 RepID=UPI0021E36652|nr:PD-(D/E)XK nuclease family protein [Paucibacter sp. DJ1R-11]MCV2362824.1 PD-(D/E)XK nuclease family protein [Paucibacter sp. DJ1R-11]